VARPSTGSQAASTRRPSRPARRLPPRISPAKVDEVAAARLQGLADEQQPAHHDVVPGLLAELAQRRLGQGLPHLDASPGQQPVAAAVLEVLDEEDAIAVEDADRDADPDLARAHGRSLPGGSAAPC